ncbi:MAG: YdcF family protein [Pirellulales bacterium]
MTAGSVRCGDQLKKIRTVRNVCATPSNVCATASKVTRSGFFRLGCLLTLVILVAGIGILVGTRETTLPAVGQWLDVGQLPRSADYVMVLAGDNTSRPFAAAALVKSGYARRVLLTEIPLSEEERAGLRPPYGELARRVFESRGVERERVADLPGECRTTYDEARALAAWIEDKPDARVAVVTTAYHTRRARWIVQTVLADQADQAYFVSVPPDGFDGSNWWRYEEGVYAYVREYLKLGFYWLRYGGVRVGVLVALAAVLVLAAAVVLRRRWRKDDAEAAEPTLE